MSQESLSVRFSKSNSGSQSAIEPPLFRRAFLNWSNGMLIAQQRMELCRSRFVLLRPPKWLVRCLVIALLILSLVYEFRTSALQSRVFSYFARHMSYGVEPG